MTNEETAIKFERRHSPSELVLRTPPTLHPEWPELGQPCSKEVRSHPESLPPLTLHGRSESRVLPLPTLISRRCACPTPQRIVGLVRATTTQRSLGSLTGEGYVSDTRHSPHFWISHAHCAYPARACVGPWRADSHDRFPGGSNSRRTVVVGREMGDVTRNRGCSSAAQQYCWTTGPTGVSVPARQPVGCSAGRSWPQRGPLCAQRRLERVKPPLRDNGFNEEFPGADSTAQS